MKEILKKLFLILLAVFFIGYLLVTAVLDLTNKKDIHTINADGAVEILEVEHSINGLIPVGKDHYYLGIDEETMDACYIKASKGWYKKNFDETGHAKISGGLDITSLSKEVSDFDVEQELINRSYAYEGVNYIISPDHCLVLSYKIDAIMKLALLAFSVVLVVTGYILFKDDKTMSRISAKIFLVAMIADLVLLLRVIM